MDVMTVVFTKCSKACQVLLEYSEGSVPDLCIFPNNETRPSRSAFVGDLLEVDLLNDQANPRHPDDHNEMYQSNGFLMDPTIRKLSGE